MKLKLLIFCLCLFNLKAADDRDTFIVRKPQQVHLVEVLLPVPFARLGTQTFMQCFRDFYCHQYPDGMTRENPHSCSSALEAKFVQEIIRRTGLPEMIRRHNQPNDFVMQWTLKNPYGSIIIHYHRGVAPYVQKYQLYPELDCLESNHLKSKL